MQRSLSGRLLLPLHPESRSRRNSWPSSVLYASLDGALLLVLRARAGQCAVDHAERNLCVRSPRRCELDID